MGEHITEPFADVVQDRRCLFRLVALHVEAGSDERETHRRERERSGIERQDPRQWQERDQRSGQQRTDDLSCRVRRLDPSVRSDQIVRRDEARNRRELARAECDEDGGLDERDAVDPPDVQVAKLRDERYRQDHQGVQPVERNHRALTVDAIHPRSDREAEKEIGEERRRGRDPETHRRVRELIHEQRHGPLRERAAEVRDRLTGPELLEVGAHETSRRIASNSP